MLRLEHGCSQALDKLCWGSHVYTSVRLHRINSPQEGRASYRRVSGSDFSALQASCFSVSSVQCTTLIQSPKRQGCYLCFSPILLLHHLDNPLDSFNKHQPPLHTKLSWPFCHLRSSALRTSCLPLLFYHPLLSFLSFLCL